jgi:hypothetical protein
MYDSFSISYGRKEKFCHPGAEHGHEAGAVSANVVFVPKNVPLTNWVATGALTRWSAEWEAMGAIGVDPPAGTDGALDTPRPASAETTTIAETKSWHARPRNRGRYPWGVTTIPKGNGG